MLPAFLRAPLRKSQRLRFLAMNGRRFKRLMLRDSAPAARIERNLERFDDTGWFPDLVTRFENEVWVEFVEGRQPAPSPETARAVASFYADLYARSPWHLPAAETPYPGRLRRDLKFLGEVGLLPDALRRDLAVAADALRPERLWIGYDYVDPVLKNFVIRADTGRLCVVDVESLVEDTLIGTGLAKAAVHWLTRPLLDAVLDDLARPGVPDIRADLPFVELCFLARWTKTKMLTGKRRFVDAGRFERFRGLARPAPGRAEAAEPGVAGTGAAALPARVRAAG